MAYWEKRKRLTGAELQFLTEQISEVDLAPGPGGTRMSPFRETALALRTYLQTLRVGVHQATYCLILPGAQIQMHVDAPIAGVRYHVPILTNEFCWCLSGGTWQRLKVAQFYQMDPTTRHGAVNWGETYRVHLILDLETSL